MIEELNIRIKDGSLTHTINVDTDIDDYLPYDIACAIEKVVDLTHVNADMVIEQLVDTYGLPERLKQQDDTEKHTCVKGDIEKESELYAQGVVGDISEDIRHLLATAYIAGAKRIER